VECILSIIKTILSKKVKENENNLLLIIDHISDVEYKPLHSRGLLEFVKASKNEPDTAGLDELRWFEDFKVVELEKILPKMQEFIAFLNTL
jgi:hypothetical protein